MKRHQLLARREPAAERFCEIHSRGAKEFVAAWLSANIAAVEAAAIYVDPTDPLAKELISFLVLKVMYALRLDGHMRGGRTLAKRTQARLKREAKAKLSEAVRSGRPTTKATSIK